MMKIIFFDDRYDSSRVIKTVDLLKSQLRCMRGDCG
jgi:hypothetical protein